jgi:hypothetical protein
MFRLTTEPYLFLGADDVKFHPGWLTAAHRAMGAMEGVVFVNDLHNPSGTLALVSRYYIDNEGGSADERGVIICPLYEHQFCDNELMEVARSRGKHAYAADSIVEHLHPAAYKAEWDDVYERGRESWHSGQALFNSRRHLWGG